MYQARGDALYGVMPSTELCVIHPGALSASCWARLASHLPAGTPVKVLELETINRVLGRTIRTSPSTRSPSGCEAGSARARARVLVGWGVGGVVADALAARLTARRGASSCSTGSRRARCRAPDEARAAALVRDVRRRPPRPHAARSTRRA